MPPKEDSIRVKALAHEATPFGHVDFIGRSLNPGTDFLVRSNCTRDALDLLVFLDSRGIGASFETSLTARILASTRSAYLCVCRPLEVTTWATLYNFLVVNRLEPKRILTNMGFVDFSAKKLSIREEAVEQVEFLMGPDVATSTAVEKYRSSTGELIDLYSTSYSPAYRDAIVTRLAGSSTVVLNTPPLPTGIQFPRERPRAFFEMLARANEFNRSLDGMEVVDFEEFDLSLTYDGVHYTERGSRLIFERIAGLV